MYDIRKVWLVGLLEFSYFGFFGLDYGTSLVADVALSCLVFRLMVLVQLVMWCFFCFID